MLLIIVSFTAIQTLDKNAAAARPFVKSVDFLLMAFIVLNINGATKAKTRHVPNFACESTLPNTAIQVPMNVNNEQ